MGVLTREDFEELVKVVFDAEELIVIATKDGEVDVNVIGYPDNLMAVNDLNDAQHHVIKTIYHSDYPPDDL